MIRRSMLLGLLWSCQTATESPTPNASPVIVPREDADEPLPSRVDAFEASETTDDTLDWTSLVPTPPTQEARVPIAIESTEEVERVRELLTSMITNHGRDVARPAVLLHALLALGPELETTDGRGAIEALFADWATAIPRGDGHLIQFPRRRNDIPVEAHRGIVLKTLTEIGADPNRSVHVQDVPLVLADYYRSLLSTAWVDTDVGGDMNLSPIFSGPRDLAWTLRGLSAWSPVDDLAWETLDGHQQSLSDLALYNFVVIHSDTQPLFLAQSGQAEFQKFTIVNGQRVSTGPYRHACGGLHALQTAAYTSARGHGQNPRVTQGILGHISNLFWRLEHELALTDEMLARPEITPIEVNWMLVQQLKNTGHFLETVSKLAALSFFTPDADQRIIIGGAVSRLTEVVLALERRGVIEELSSLATSEAQLFRDLINDSAHALNGLELALGLRTVRY